MLFGSNGHKLRPAGLQIENYTMSLPAEEKASSHVKMFVRPHRIEQFVNPHFAMPREGWIVTTSGNLIRSPFSRPPVRDVCQINHYYYRSKQDFYLKMLRSRADIVKKHSVPKHVNIPYGSTQDLSAARYAPAVRSLLLLPGRCAMLAKRLPVPESPEQVVEEFATYLRQGQNGDALILLAKARQRFPEHPVILLLSEQAAELREKR
jgi:hypothetical protein